MRGRDQAGRKWAIYLLLLLGAFVLERCVFNRLILWNALPTLLPLLVSAIGFLEGSAAGGLLGLLAGFLTGSTTGEVGPVWLYPLMAIGCGTTRDKALGRTFLGYLLCAGAGMLFLEGSHILWRGLFKGWDMAAMLPVALGEAGCSLLFVPVWYAVCWQVNDRLPAELRV